MHVWQGLIEFVPQVVGQIVADVVRLFNLGFTNIAVTQLPPLGCEPVTTITDNYTACVFAENLLATFHNSLLVSNLSSTLPHANIIFLDFYNAFYSIFDASPGTTGKTPNIIFTLNVFLLSSNPKRRKLKIRSGD
jgi:phospholipase/lecithinase/hemolysin